ncbi:hypothetical protein Pcac1_g25693 [Phytophthora cactorum]|nr:hypothetical protein Pcac1_g25693 [Phytophthora cactorum]KAG2808396.1 hypothetical protein PC111_g16505 [Phytophthora cactorum]
MAHIINRAFVVHQGKRALSNFGKVPCLVGSNADLDNTDSALSLATGLSCDDTREKETWQRDILDQPTDSDSPIFDTYSEQGGSEVIVMPTNLTVSEF